MNLKNSKVLITGSSGFIGTYLKKHLVERGSIVTSFDRQNGKDVLDEAQLKKYISKKYDAIFHLAALSGPVKSDRDKLRTYATNTRSTVIICQHLARYSPRTKLILSSSRLEYGKVRYLPVDESHPTVPTTTYGQSKLSATQLALTYNTNNNLHVTVFRTSNVYGNFRTPKFNGYNIINHFISQATQNRNLTIFGRGNQQRDYIYIDDLVEAFILGLNKKASGQIYNLGLGRSISLRNMAKIIIKIAGKGKIQYKKWPSSYKMIETGSYVSNISKIKRELNFKPKVDFQEGVERSIRGQI